MNETYDDASYVLDFPIPSPSTLRQFSDEGKSSLYWWQHERQTTSPPPAGDDKENQRMMSDDCIVQYVY